MRTDLGVPNKNEDSVGTHIVERVDLRCHCSNALNSGGSVTDTAATSPATTRWVVNGFRGRTRVSSDDEIDKGSRRSISWRNSSLASSEEVDGGTTLTSLEDLGENRRCQCNTPRKEERGSLQQHISRQFDDKAQVVGDET